MRLCYLYVCIWVLISGCGEDANCLKSTGKIVREKRSLPAFSVLTVNDNIDLILTSGSSQEVEIEAGENIMDGIHTEVVNDHLTISNVNKCNWLRSYDKKIKVYLSQPALWTIFNLSSGTITSANQCVFDSLVVHNYGNGTLDMNVKCRSLSVDTNFFGDINFSGETTGLWIHTFRLARLDTRRLKCQHADILSDSDGDLYVYAENSITGKIRNTGNVYYSGNPAVDVEFEGKGKLIKQ